MNPKFIFPIPTKNSQNSPFDRIQSAPPEGKEDDKKTDQDLKQFLKSKPINQNPNVTKVLPNIKIPLIVINFQKLNTNSQTYHLRHPPPHPVPVNPQPEPVKKVVKLSNKSIAFKADNPPINNTSEPVIQNTLPIAIPIEKQVEAKKKLSLKSNSKPFVTPEQPKDQISIANVPQINAPSFVPNISQTTFQNPVTTTTVTPSFILSEHETKALPKMGGKKQLKPPIHTTRSSGDLPSLQKERTEEALERANILSAAQKDKFLEAKDTSNLASIVEEVQKIDESQKKSAQIFAKSEFQKEPEQGNKKEPSHVILPSPTKKKEETKSESPVKKPKAEIAKPVEKPTEKPVEKPIEKPIETRKDVVSVDETKKPLEEKEKATPIPKVEEEESLKPQKEEKLPAKILPTEQPKTHYKELILGLIQVISFKFLQ